MKTDNLCIKITVLFVFFIVTVALVNGCAGTKSEKKDTFFDEWKEKAEKSKGYSPAAIKDGDDISALKPDGKPDDKPDDKNDAEKDKRIKEETDAQEKEISADPEKPLPVHRISLRMHNIEVAVLLRTLAKAADQNIMINERIKGKTSINIKNSPWDQVFRSILRTHGLTYTREEDIISIMTLEDMEQDLMRKTRKKDLKMVGPLLIRIVRVNYSDAKKLNKSLQNFLSKDKEKKQIGSITVDEHTNSIIIQAIGHDIERIVPIIKALDRPTPQVKIEAHIVETSKDTARELGIQWGGLYHSDGDDNHWITSGVNSAVGVPLDSEGAVDPKSGMAVNFPAALDDAIGMNIGYIAEDIGDYILAVQLSALQKEGRLNILSSPSITTIDNQEAIIESGRDVPFQTVEDDEVKIEWKKAVLSLKVTPHVIDKRTLKLKIKTNKDELDFSRPVAGNPTIITKNAETTVVVFDGQTTVIGGLSKETTTNAESGVPWLMDIPLLGYLFKSKGKSKNMEEVLIFITPHILKKKAADNIVTSAQ